MRHRRKGRKLGRNPKHQRALLRNMASDLILTLRDPEHPLFDTELGDDARRVPKAPKVPGRIITTLAKAKEVRPLVEKCITLARKALGPLNAADKLGTTAERGSTTWKQWRTGEGWKQWNAAIAPAVAVRRRLITILGSREAVEILIDDLAPRFEDRPGGYTRVVKLAAPRLGDAGDRAILEFVGKNDRVRTRSQKPSFEAESAAT